VIESEKRQFLKSSSFYDATSDVSIDELLGSHEQFSNTAMLDPDSLFCYQTGSVFDTPSNYKQATTGTEREKWKSSIQEELQSIYENNVWELVPKPPDAKPIGCRYIFTKKLDEHGNVARYKSRLVAKGYAQRYGVDFEETYAPVAKFKSIRTIVAIAALGKLALHQMDVKTAFLNGILKETVYMDVPEGVPNPKGYVCKLKKTLYGLKQSPREWNRCLDDYLCENGYVPLDADPCVYVKKKNKQVNLIVGVFVDDIVIAGKDASEVSLFKDTMKTRFKMTDLGKLSWYLGTRILRHENGDYSMDQSRYIENKLKQYMITGGAATPLDQNFQELLENPTDDIVSDFPYRSAVGSLMYAMIGTRPDIAAAVSIVSRHLENPKKVHCAMVIRIWQYLKANTELGLVYRQNGNSTLIGYVDASYANAEGARSMSGYGFMLADALISWVSQRQPVVALSTAEAEYVAVTSAAQEVVWLKLLLLGLGKPHSTIELMEDNQACILLSKNPQDHKRTKHIQVRYHYIREQITKGVFILKYCPTKSQLADIFTKGLGGPILRNLRSLIGVHTIRIPGGCQN
jgi:hypothetical protein